MFIKQMNIERGKVDSHVFNIFPRDHSTFTKRKTRTKKQWMKRFNVQVRATGCIISLFYIYFKSDSVYGA